MPYYLIIILLVASLSVANTYKTGNLNGPCEDETDCIPLNSICAKDKSCQCDKPYYAEKNKCFAKIGSRCRDVDCQIDGAKCVHENCTCLEDKSPSSDKMACISIFYELGGFCFDDWDCKILNSKCSAQNKCECSVGFVEHNNECLRRAHFGDRCSSQKQCACKNNVDCSTAGLYKDLICSIVKKCDCPHKHHYVPEKFSCFPFAIVLYDYCVTDETCGTLQNSVCSSGKCECAPYHFEQSGKCVKGIGSNCSIIYDKCQVINSICVANKCQCPIGWHLSLTKLSCIKDPIAPGDFCEQEFDCESVPNSHCDNQKCKCSEQFVAVENKCLEKANYGETCELHKQCACENKNCSCNKPYVEQQCHGTCGCPAGHHYVPKKFLCVPSATGLGGVCLNNDSCSLIGNAACSNGTCVCQRNHFEQNKKCVKGIGADCSKTADCSANGSVCCENKCACKSHMHARNNTCVINVLGDACMENTDCKGTMFAVCSNKKCSCDKNYTKRNNQCFPSVRTKCQTNDQCKRPSGSIVMEQVPGTKFDGVDLEPLYHDLVCSKPNCSCSEGFHYVKNQFSCIKTTKSVGELCLVNDHCQLLERTDCVNNKCKCKESYWEQGGVCKAGVGANCSKGEDCDARNTMCSKSSNRCTCKPRNIYHSVEQCKPVRAFEKECDVDDQCSCLHGENCYVKAPYHDLICSKNCNCPKGSHFVPSKSSCITTTSVVEGVCDTDDNCLFLNYTECRKNHCSCVEHYFVSEGECKQGLQSNCSSDDDCSAVPNARCQEHCKCMAHNVEQSTGRCVSVLEFGAECEFDIQCEATTRNSTCRQNSTGSKTCQCRDGEQVRNNGCYKFKNLNETCDDSNECHLEAFPERANCLDHKCVCLEKFEPINATYCDGAGSIVASISLTAFLFLLKVIL